MSNTTTNALHPNAKYGTRGSLDEIDITNDSVSEGGSRQSSVSYESNIRSATMASCFFNLANTIVGSGMLGLPYAYSHSGWVLGSFLLLVCGCSSAFALHLLSLCAAKQGAPSSFYSIASVAMPVLTVVIDGAVAIKCFGVATSYLIVIADLMPDVMEQLGASAGAQDRKLWVFLGFCVVAPLSLLRNLDSLKFTSTLSIGFVIFLTILIILYSAHINGMDPCETFDDGETCVGQTTNGVVNVHTFQVLSIFVFGYTCQQNIFAVTNELHNPTQPRVNLVIVSAIGVAFVIYMIVAGCGYATYGSSVDPDILVNYPNNYLTSVARLFVSLLVAFSYPLQCHPSRRSILSLLTSFDAYRAARNPDTQGLVGAGGKSEVSDMEGNGTTTSTTSTPALPPPLSEHQQFVRFMTVTACFLGLSLVIALTITNLGTVLAFVGATGSTTVSYILPGFFYYIVFKDEGPVWKRYLALAQGITGLILVPLCLTFIFL
jgi:amino acid permease